MRKIVLVAGLVVIAVIFGLFAALPAAAQGDECVCEPKVNWVYDCLEEGWDSIANHDATVEIELLSSGVVYEFHLIPCPGSDSILAIHREGQPDSSIATEIVSMCLTDGNITLIAGYGLGQGSVLGHSYGAIVQFPDMELAESSFDVFFEVEGVGPRLYNHRPHRVKEEIKCVPPQFAYYHMTGEPLPLYTDPVGGDSVAYLVAAVHRVNVKATLQFTSSTCGVYENGGSATIIVTRTGGSYGEVGVDYTTSDGTATAGLDYTPTFGTITFPAWDMTPKIFTVPIIDDDLIEGDETVNLTLSNPTGGATLGTPNTAELTIIDDDHAFPSLSQWVLLVLTLSVGGFFIWQLKRRRKAAASLR